MAVTDAFTAAFVHLGVIALVMLFVWMLSLYLKDASIIDPCWGLGFVLLAWMSLFRLEEVPPRAVLLTTLTTVWGLRLGVFLLWRNWGKDEDRRYRAMREHHGQRFWIVSLVTVFLLQAVLMWFISWPVQFGILLSENGVGWLDFIGLFLCVVGIFFESVGDFQLARFLQQPENQGKVLDHGLWRYTRHPNYFGDFCVWWGLYLIAAAGGSWWTVASPLVMSFFLLKVSGVTLLESNIAERRPEYQDYAKRTNAFFPGPPS